MGSKVVDKDTQLIHRVRDGDMQAFRTLVDLYKDKSLSLAMSILKDKPLAEDVLQEAFIKVYRNIEKFKFKSKFSTWLYRIVVNTSYNQLKKKKRTFPLSEDDYTFEPLAENNVGLSLKHNDQKEFIKKAMARIRPDEALTLRLFYLCEMNLKEVEDVTKFSASKIRVDLYRGRKNLEEQLQKLLGKHIDDLL